MDTPKWRYAAIGITLSTGDGVPTVPKETAGRKGKGPDGRAHTREVKLVCLFTQAGLDDRGHPQRDPNSSSYVAAVESAEKLGQILYAEAMRRVSARPSR